jgi:hypothetical protein
MGTSPNVIRLGHLDVALEVLSSADGFESRPIGNHQSGPLQRNELTASEFADRPCDCFASGADTNFVKKEYSLMSELEPSDFCAIAPVNEPFSRPNSSLSRRPEGIAEQLGLTKA